MTLAYEKNETGRLNVGPRHAAASSLLRDIAGVPNRGMAGAMRSPIHSSAIDTTVVTVAGCGQPIRDVRISVAAIRQVQIGRFDVTNVAKERRQALEQMRRTRFFGQSDKLRPTGRKEHEEWV